MYVERSGSFRFGSSPWFEELGDFARRSIVKTTVVRFTPPSPLLESALNSKYQSVKSRLRPVSSLA